MLFDKLTEKIGFFDLDRSTDDSQKILLKISDSKRVFFNAQAIPVRTFVHFKGDDFFTIRLMGGSEQNYFLDEEFSLQVFEYGYTLS